MKVVALLLCASLVVVVGCTAGEPSREPSSDQTTSRPPTPSPSPTYDPVSLPAMFEEQVRGGDLRRVGEPVDVGPYTRREVRYSADDTRVSGVLLTPDGDGPFPAVVLNHGYIDPDVYVSGQGMMREQDYLARRGWVVLHTDYRGHAASDDVGPLELEMRLGYARDAIAAVRTLRGLEEVDADRVAMLGRSMGGGVTLNALVAEPGIVDAAVVHASVSSRFEDNLRQFTEPGRPDRVEAMQERWGSPEESPDFYADVSSRTYAERVDASVLMIHGERDDTCPVEWARETERSFTAAGADVTLRTYDGEGHTFAAGWEDSMRRTVRFLERRLDG